MNYLKLNIKKLVISFSLIISFSFYAGGQEDELEARQVHANTQQKVAEFISTVITPSQSTTTNSFTQLQSTQPSTNTSIPIPTPVIVQKPRGIYYDGKYTGISADAYYGNVQVQVTILNGKITDVIFLDYPQDRRNSIVINNEAMPYLKQETIQAQSANIDIVSGATATSEAFQQSLASALAKAKI